MVWASSENAIIHVEPSAEDHVGRGVEVVRVAPDEQNQPVRHRTVMVSVFRSNKFDIIGTRINA